MKLLTIFVTLFLLTFILALSQEKGQNSHKNPLTIYKDFYIHRSSVAHKQLKNRGIIFDDKTVGTYACNFIDGTYKLKGNHFRIENITKEESQPCLSNLDNKLIGLLKAATEVRYKKYDSTAVSFYGRNSKFLFEIHATLE